MIVNGTSAGSDQDLATTTRNQLKIVEEHVESSAGSEPPPAENTASTLSNDLSSGEEFNEKIINTRISEENKENSLPKNRKLLLRGQSQVALPVKFE